MSVEIIRCPRCGAEYDLYYSLKDDDEVIGQSSCKCNKKTALINGKKPLDYALEVLRKELLNEKSKQSTRSISITTKTGNQRK